MENESYKKLYYHAFNRLTDLIKEIQQAQSELEEIYLALKEIQQVHSELEMGETPETVTN